jgi:hypothetical protein
MPQTRLAFGLAFVLTFAMRASDVLAWGDQGHQVIGIIAEHYLEPKVRDKVRAMLRQDDSGLTRSHGIAAESTWADKYRDSDRRTAQRRYRATRSWHFIDLELDGPDPDQACFGHPSIGVGAYASTGPAQDCVVDKIGEFARCMPATITIKAGMPNSSEPPVLAKASCIIIGIPSSCGDWAPIRRRLHRV